MRVGGKAQIRSHQFAAAHFALTLFGSHVFESLHRGCFGARTAPALRAFCVIGTPSLPGQAVGDAQTQARRGGRRRFRKLAGICLRRSEGAICCSVRGHGGCRGAVRLLGRTPDNRQAGTRQTFVQVMHNEK